jgi:RNA recognition motif-containing protein
MQQPHSKKPKTSPLAVAKHADGAHKEQALQDKKKHTPYVVFVGQLPFGCTSEELLTHFQKGGLQGEIRIRYFGRYHIVWYVTARRRLLTSKNENKSKGTAFVEVDSAEQVGMCKRNTHMHELILPSVNHDL